MQSSPDALYKTPLNSSASCQMKQINRNISCIFHAQLPILPQQPTFAYMIIKNALITSDNLTIISVLTIVVFFTVLHCYLRSATCEQLPVTKVLLWLESLDSSWASCINWQPNKSMWEEYG